jgi:hypothetical protein
VYLAPGAELAFGDIFQAEWLFDVYVRADSKALYKSSTRGFSPNVVPWIERGTPTGNENEPVKVAATMEADDVVLTFGTLRMGIVVTDDCELETLAGRDGREPGGRALMAGLRRDDGRPIDDLDLGLHRLPAHDDFPGALVDFDRLYAVQTKSLVRVDAERPVRKVLSLDSDAKDELAQRFAGHLVRQGPVAGEGAARKLSRLLTARDDVAAYRALASDAANWGHPTYAEATETVADVIEEAWFLGRLSDEVDDLAERTISGSLGDGDGKRREVCRKVAVSLEELAKLAADSAARMRDLAS